MTAYLEVEDEREQLEVEEADVEVGVVVRQLVDEDLLHARRTLGALVSTTPLYSGGTSEYHTIVL